MHPPHPRVDGRDAIRVTGGGQVSWLVGEEHFGTTTYVDGLGPVRVPVWAAELTAYEP